MNFSRPFLLLVLLLVAAITVGLLVFGNRKATNKLPVATVDNPQGVVADNEVDSLQANSLAGIDADVASSPIEAETELAQLDEEDISEDAEIENPYGETPMVDLDSTPQTKALKTIVASGQNLERLSPLGQADVFDLEKYRNDPEYRKSYLETPVSARVFSPAQPGKGVEHIARVSPRRVQVLQGDIALLRVKSLPKTPITFTSFDLGRFKGSQLTTLTVETDEEGVAMAEFETPQGTAGDVNVLVAGPVTTGQVKFSVNVALTPQ